MKSRHPFHIMANPVGPICNLRCTHCYYLEKKELYPDSDGFAMPDEVLEKLTKSYIEAMPDAMPEVQFAWQGGEPTMAGLDFFKRAVELQKKYARKGLKIANALQTNGTLLNDEWGVFLKENGFLVGISMDGPAEIHDKYRLDEGGRGSFEKVLRGLEVLNKHKVDYNALVCIQGDNASRGVEVYDYLKSVGVRYFQFIPIIEPIKDNTPTIEAVRAGQWGEFLKSIFDHWVKADIGEVFVQHFETILAMVSGGGAPLCVHAQACGRALALEHNGDLYACDHFVNEADKLGNILDKELVEMVDSEKQTNFGQDKHRSLPGHCKKCEFLGLCFGGCPAHRTRKSPQGEPGLNYLCEGYRAIYKHTVPYFQAMANCLRQGRPASDFVHGECPCGSGEKYAECCGKK
jgi:uncharacterized protein